MRKKLHYLALGSQQRLFTLLIFSLVCIFSIGEAAAQRTTYDHFGVVKDETGAPLPGVTVFEEETSRGTITDHEGRYALRLTQEEINLMYSFIGYTTLGKASKAGESLEVALRTEDVEIEDIVVIGYGEVKKSDLTGSVVSIGQETFEDRSIVSFEDALIGAAAGVYVMETDGEPGATMTIQIRGVGSTEASTDPLYVIDGVTYELDDVIISPDEIESIDILKDASATAIYGSLGANGVVIITTKGAKDNQRASVSYSGNMSRQTTMRKYELMNSQEIARWLKWGPASVQGDTTTFLDPDGYEFDYANGGGTNAWWEVARKIIDGENTIDTDWQDECFSTAKQTNHSVTISGSDKNGKFSITGTYYDQMGIINTAQTQRYTVRTNVERNLYTWLKAGVNISGSIQQGERVIGQITRNIMLKLPYQDWSNVIDFVEGEETDPDSYLYEAIQGDRKSIYKNIASTMKSWLEFKFSPTFRLRSSGSYGLTFGKAEYWTPIEYDANNGLARATITERTSWSNDNLFYITPTLKNENHKVDGLVGYTLSGRMAYSLQAYNTEFLFNDLTFYNMSMGTESNLATNSYSYQSSMSAFTRVNYSIKQRYLFTATMRADASTKFGDDDKWGYFPSGAFAWRINNEPFMKNFKKLNNLKFRASYGISGNQGISAYQTLATLTSTLYPMDGEDSQTALQVSRPEAEDLKWEESKQLDLGFDLGLFKNRLKATFDVYYKRTQDMLINETVPTFTGYSQRWTNKGIFDNKGVEFDVTAIPITNKKFRWTVSANIYANRSKVVYWSADGDYIYGTSVAGTTNYFLMQNGAPLCQFYGYNYQGVYKSQQEINDLGMKTFFGNEADIYPGQVKFEDVNGDGAITEDDRQIIGCAEATFRGGFSTNLKYKQFNLKMGFDFRYGGNIYNSTLLALENDSNNARNRPARMAESGWYPTLYYSDSGQMYNQGTEESAIYRRPFNGTTMSHTQYCSTLYVEDASYLRLNNVTLSYNLPTKVANRLYMSKLSVFVAVKNVFFLTGYSGYSPAVNSGSLALQQGVDNSAYPSTRNYSGGVNISF